MRVRGDLPPSNAFSLEAQPNKPGFVLARFYENAAPFEDKMDGLTISGYEYDEYHLELADTGDLQSDILNNYDYYFGVAKSQDAAQASGGDEPDSGMYTQSERNDFVEGMMSAFGYTREEMADE